MDLTGGPRWGDRTRNLKKRALCIDGLSVYGLSVYELLLSKRTPPIQVWITVVINSVVFLFKNINLADCKMAAIMKGAKKGKYVPIVNSQEK